MNQKHSQFEIDDPFAEIKLKAKLGFQSFKEKKKSSNHELFKLLELDNTNKDIVYFYLTFIKKRHKIYFNTEFNFRMIFLTQHQIEKLVPQCPFAKDSYEIIFTYLIKNIQFESFQTILSQHFERYRLYNPYTAKNMSEDNIFFEYNNKKYSVFKDIRPKFSLSMKSKEDFFKFVLFKMELEKERIMKFSYLYYYSFIMIYQLFLKKVEIDELITIFHIMFLADAFKLLTYLYSLNEKYQLQITLPARQSDQETKRKLSNLPIQSLLVQDENALATFSSVIKPSLFKFLRQIIESKCIKELLSFIYPKLTEEELLLLDESFITYSESITEFAGLYNSRLFGYYYSINNKILINQLIRYTNKEYGFGLLYLLHTGVYLITLIHEILGHFSRRYIFSLLSEGKNSNITDRTLVEVINDYNQINKKNKIPIPFPEDNNDKMEGSRNVETLLFGNERKILSAKQVIFLLSESSWKMNLNAFRAQFILNGKENLTIEEISKKANTNFFFGEFEGTFQYTKQNDIPPQTIEYVKIKDNTDFIEQTISMEGKLEGYKNGYCDSMF